MTSLMMETGCIYDPNEPEVLTTFLKKVDHGDIADWKKQIAAFIIEWLDTDRDYIGQQTSGSTGRPKNIQLSKSWMRASAQATAKALELKPGMQSFLCIPARFIGGRMMIVRAMEVGMRLFVQEPSQSPSPEGYRFDFCAMVPNQVSAILKDKKEISAFGTIIIGGAPIHPALELELVDSTADCYSTFGMTETSSHVALRRIGELDAPYICLPGVRASQWDDGRLAIEVEHFDGQRFETQDVVELIDEARFHWLGRFDHVINSGGVKLHPEALEKKYARFIPCPFFFHGAPDDELGTRLILCLETQDHELTAGVQDIPFERYERPKKIMSLERFLRTENGKIQREETVMSAD